MSNESLRMFFKHFTNLKPSQRMEFERIVNDVEGTLNSTSLQTDLQQFRRKPNSRLPIPQPTVQATVRGAIIEWLPLDDPKINFYEVDIAEQLNFANFETIVTIGASVVIDGITSSKFVRIRGVRRNGETTSYSQTVAIEPILFDIRLHSEEAFYIPIDQPITPVVGGEGSALEYTPTNPRGQSLVYGFVTAYGDPNTGVTGRGDIAIRVSAQTFDEDGIELTFVDVFRETLSEYFGSHAIGPATVQHGPLNSRLIISMVATDAGPTEEVNTQIEWVHLNSVELGIS